MNTSFDVCVIGAGLAGLHTALELTEYGAKVCIIDPNGVAGGASGTPVGLANPATGRFASRSWEAEKSLTRLTNRLDQIQAETKQQFFRKSGVLRPALDEEIAKKMKENIQSKPWKDGTVEWWNESKVKEFHPGINCIGGGVWIPGGLTVHIPDYLGALSNYLKKSGCHFVLNQEYTFEPGNSCTFSFDSGLQLSTYKAIFTAGIWSGSFDLWKELKLSAIKGQTAVMQSSRPIGFNHAVSAMGYFSGITDHTFILGSTYEHNFDHTAPDKNGLDYMMKRLKKVLPDLGGSSKPVSKWAGIRASTPDRNPLVGSHPEYENCFLFSGLGSKGLLYSAYIAKLLVLHVLKQEALPVEIDFKRFYK